MKNKDWKGMNNHAGSSAVYGLGLVGAAIYFLQRATTFGDGVPWCRKGYPLAGIPGLQAV